MEIQRVLYYCDPDKNKECRKRSCYCNKNSLYRECRYTSNLSYAKSKVPTIITISIDGLLCRYRLTQEWG